MFLTLCSVEPFRAGHLCIHTAVVIKHGHIVHSNSLHVIGQIEALRADEKGTEGVNICKIMQKDSYVLIDVLYTGLACSVRPSFRCFQLQIMLPILGFIDGAIGIASCRERGTSLV